MRLSRLQFKYAVRKCRANKQIMRADTLAHVLYNRQSTSFWKDVRKMTSSKVSFATKVGDAVDNDQITDMWRQHFSKLPNCVYNSESACYNVSECFLQIDIVSSEITTSCTCIAATDVLDILKETKLAKYARIDSPAAEHIVYSPSRIRKIC